MIARRLVPAFHWASFAYLTLIWGVFALLAVVVLIDLVWRWVAGENLILPPG